MPFAGILFFGTKLGNNNIILTTFGDKTFLVITITALMTLVSIRLSVMLKKREFSEKIPFVRGIVKFVPNITKKQLKEGYISFFYDFFFTVFMSFMVIMLFKVIFLREQTVISWGGFTASVQVILNIAGSFFLSNILFFLLILLIILISEAFLWNLTYDEFIQN